MEFKMEVPTPTHVFESGLHHRSHMPSNANRLDSLIRQKLEMATHDVAQASGPSPLSMQNNPKTVLNDMGDYITQTACIWAHLTESLVRGPHIHDAAREALMQTKNETHCADLTPVAAMDLDLDKLRKIRDLTAQYSQDVQDVWTQKKRVNDYSTVTSSAASGIEMNSLSVSEDSKSNVRRVLPGTVNVQQQDPNSPLDDGSGSDDSDEEDDERFSQSKMDALKTRGKGDHYCPKGYQCTKGGVDKDGSLVLFDRNSAFAQHCNKHRKPYRCTLEGCPNPIKKRRFARRDGLERHQKHVPHVLSRAVGPAPVLG